MRKIWFTFLLCLAVFFGLSTPAHAATHDINLSWYYGRNSEFENFYNGEAGTKLGQISLTVEDGTFDYRTYAEDPEGANFYMYYGMVPIIRVNGNYYMLQYIYVEANGNQDQMNFTVDLTDEDPTVNIRLGYVKVAFAQPSNLDKIKVSVDNSVSESLTSPQTYAAYQILHVTKADSVQEDVTTDETIGRTLGTDDEGFAYYILTTDPWYNVVASMTDYFTLTPTTSESMFMVHLADGIAGNEETAIAIAAELEKYTDGKESIEIESGQARLDIDPGYYLIVSPISSNLILATTNIDITEKAFYPTIDKTVAEKDINSAIGSEVHFISVISIPRGSKADLIITDTMTDGLRFNPESLSMNYEFNYTFKFNDRGFIITIAGNDLKQLAAEENIELELQYTATLTKEAICSPTDEGSNINDIQLQYGNLILKDSVDVFSSLINVLKYDAEDDTKAAIGGATFQLLDENKEVISLYEVEIGEVYRLVTDTDTSSMDHFTTENGKTITIRGLDTDSVYYLREIEAPDGYNRYPEDIQFQSSIEELLTVEIPNSTGTELPSTGGRGTTFMYIAGTIIILCAGGVLAKNYLIQ